MFKQRGIWAALVVAIAALAVGIGFAGSSPRTAQANHCLNGVVQPPTVPPVPCNPDEMTIFAATTGAGVQGTCPKPGVSVPVCTVLNPTVSPGDGDGDQGTGATGPAPVPVTGACPTGCVDAIISVTRQTAALQGYQWEIAFLTSVLAFDSYTDLDSDLSLCSPPASVAFGSLTIVGQGAGCLSSNAAGAMFQNPVERITLKCVAAGNTYVALVGLNADPTFGTTLIAVGGAISPTTLENQLPNPLPPPTTVAAIVVACLQPVDVAITKTGPANANTGGTGTYTLHITNTGPGTVNVDMSDAAPVGTNFTSIDHPPIPAAPPAPAVGGCTLTGVDPADPAKFSSATCSKLPIPPGTTGVDVHIGVDFKTCGSKTNSASVQVSTGQAVVDANPANNSSQAVTNVDCPVLSLTKSVDLTKIIAGGSVTFTDKVCNDSGVIPPGSAAHNVVLDDKDAGTKSLGTIAGNTCVLVTSTKTFPAPGTFCNTDTATSSDAGNPTSNSVCVTVNPALTHNGMVKDCFNPEKETKAQADADIDNKCNIFLHKSEPGKMPLGSVGISEILNLPKDVDTCNDDDDGDGPNGPNPLPRGGSCAGINGSPLLPFQDVQDLCGLAIATVKGQPVFPKHYIPRQTAVDCNGTPGNNDSGEVGEGLGAIEFQIKYDHKLFQQPVLTACTFSPNRVMQPVVSVITENWTLFGCVTKDSVVTPGKDQGDLQPSGNVATIIFTPQPDLFQRIRPTKDNGVVTDLLDENCEAADIHGEAWPGTVQGGLLVDCGDATITIRMLEGDVTLDCAVTVADDQAMAFRYGSFFGNLLYNRFFDLEPSIAPDFDIDIKDLQTVFGRNGSTCNNPQPDQFPQNQVPDP